MYGRTDTHFAFAHIITCERRTVLSHVHVYVVRTQSYVYCDRTDKIFQRDVALQGLRIKHRASSRQPSSSSPAGGSRIPDTILKRCAYSSTERAARVKLGQRTRRLALRLLTQVAPIHSLRIVRVRAAGCNGVARNSIDTTPYWLQLLQPANRL